MNYLKVWLAAAVPGLVPGWLLSQGVFALAFAIGATLPAAGLGAIALFAGRHRADRGLRVALGVAVAAGVVCAAVAVYGTRHS